MHAKSPHMKTIRDIGDIRGKNVLVRADFNVPLMGDMVSDDFRIRAALPTIDALLDKGAKVILMSHLESNAGDIPSLEPVARHLKGLDYGITFIPDTVPAREVIDGISTELILLDNLRLVDGEKSNDEGFARRLATLADIYVNEAFSVSHRSHASVVGVPQLMPHYAGLQFEREISELSKAFDPSHPFLFILGGAKLATKMPLVEKFAPLADSIFIGGALANDLLKAQGREVGQSTTSASPVDLSQIISDPKIFSYVDVMVTDDGVKDASQLSEGDTIVDAGHKTIEMLRSKIAAARFILWNGPFGIYEQGFTWGTEECARLIAENVSATKIVGGGDTLAAIAKLGIEDKFSFVSTGGGAMLDFLARGTIPGLEALKG